MIFKVFIYLFICLKVHLDFKHVFWSILVKAVPAEATETHWVAGLYQTYLSAFYFPFHLFLNDTQATPKGTILSALSDEYLGTSSWTDFTQRKNRVALCNEIKFLDPVLE